MNRKYLSGVAFGAVAMALCAISPADAHHSFAMFDRTKTVKVSGTIKEFDWTNPHIYIWLNAVDTKGKQQTYGIESASPGVLVRHGWTRNTLKMGDKVMIEINPLRDGRPGGSFVRLTLANGTTMTTGAGALEPGQKEKEAAEAAKIQAAADAAAKAKATTTTKTTTTP